MKKIIASILSIIVCIFCITPLVGCSELSNIFNSIVENEILIKANDELEKENQLLKEELATLKFEIAFPNGVIDKDCILENVRVEKKPLSDSEEDQNSWKNASIYALRVKDTKVTINGGFYNAGEGSSYNIALRADGSANVIINDGVFITGNDINNNSNHCIYAADGATIEINGGLFKSNGDATWLLNCKDNTNSQIIVKGGTFINFNPSNCISEGTNTNFVANGYEVKTEIITNDTEEYTIYKVVPIIIEK